MFAHELIRQTLIATLSIPRRQRLHLKVADAIERVHAAALEKHISALAHHLYNAGAAADPLRAASFLLRAGRAALASAAFEDALTFFDNGLALDEDLEPATRADLFDGRADALRSLGRATDAIASWHRALSAFEAQGNVRRLGEVALRLGWTEMWNAQYATGVATMKRGLARVGDDLPSLRAWLLVGVGTGIGAGDGYDEAAPLIREAGELAERSGDVRLIGAVLANAAMHHWNYFECRQAERAVERMIETIGTVPEMRYVVSDAAWIGAWVKLWQGRPQEARASLDEWEREAERIGHAGATWVLKLLRGTLTALDGRIDHALEQMVAATAFGRAHEVPWRFHSVYSAGALLTRLGRADEAIAAGREAVALEPRGTAWDGISLAYLFEFLAAAGDREADDVLPKLRAFLPVTGRPNTFGRWRVLVCMVRGLAYLGRHEDLAALYPLVADRLDAGDSVLADTSVTWEHLAGLCAEAAGNRELADGHFARARVLHERIGLNA
jgi:tetratricopeptide (TPR) repeat protein